MMDADVKPMTTVVEEKTVKRHFLRELKQELKKVSWTTKAELIQSTKMVVGATFFLGLGIYLVDLMIKGFLNLVGLLAHLLGG